MKNILKSLLLCFLLLSLIFCTLACRQEDPDGAQGAKEIVPIVTYLGTPIAERYPEGDIARCPWDLALHDGGVFMGGGDYDKNKGPVDLWRYDIAKGTFSLSASIPDEQVDRFCYVFDELATPGIDPKEDWELGNYFTYTDGEWVKHRTIPGGVHVFDIIEFDSILIAGLGVVAGEYPAAYSIDGGESFRQMPFYKEDALLDTSYATYVRVYDFFVCGEELYAYVLLGNQGDLVYELYRYEYDDDAFYYVEDWTNKLDRVSYRFSKIGANVSFDGTLVFTTGYLYTATEMTNPIKQTIDGVDLVADLYVANGRLYALCATKNEDGTFTNAVYTTDSLDAPLTKLFEFSYEIPAMSFVVDGNDFYVGMGYRRAHEKNGALLHILLSTK